jgi:hypothetical protein
MSNIGEVHHKRLFIDGEWCQIVGDELQIDKRSSELKRYK